MFEVPAGFTTLKAKPPRIVLAKCKETNVMFTPKFSYYVIKCDTSRLSIKRDV